MPTKNLFLNTLAFKFPKDPVTFYFSLTDRKNVNLTKLNHQLFPSRVVDYNNVYPIVQNSLASYLGLSEEQEEEHPNPRVKKNRYTKYISKIIEFKNRFISTEEFKKIIPVVDHFTPVQAGKTNEESKRLVFGKKTNSNENMVDVIPQWGINAGPYSQPRHNNIQLFFIVSAAHTKNIQAHSSTCSVTATTISKACPNISVFNSPPPGI